MFLTPNWCALAISEAKAIGTTYRGATTFVPAVGADWGALLVLLLIRIPIWVVLLAPSFPALGVLLFMFPKPTASIEATRSRLDWLRSHPRQVILLGIVAVGLATLLQVVLHRLGVL